MGVGTTDGTATDIDGQFSLSLPETVNHIKVSYVGMHTRELAIAPTGTMRIELTSANQLDEVIAVAYGTAKRSTYTGSASVVSASDISDRLVTDVTSVLKEAQCRAYSFSRPPASPAKSPQCSSAA